jgi:hypothetical protein
MKKEEKKEKIHSTRGSEDQSTVKCCGTLRTDHSL